MFIKVTLKDTEVYINVSLIKTFIPIGDNTKILIDGEVIKVNESLDEILKLIEAVQGHGNQA